MKIKSAFTLIELLVVIAIIALLLSILMPSLNLVKSVAKRTVCSTHLKSIGQGIVTYATENSDKLPVSWYQTGSGQGVAYVAFMIDTTIPYSDNLGHVTATYGMGYLYETKIIETPELFYCTTPYDPSGAGWAATSYKYEDYLDDGSRWPWNSDPSGWNTQYVRTGYNYTPQSAKNKTTVGADEFPVIATKFSQLRTSYVMVSDLIWSLEQLPHKIGDKPGGANVMYSDGSVQFNNDSEAFSEALWQDNHPGSDEWLFRTILRMLE